MDIDPSSDSGVSVAGAACPESVPCPRRSASRFAQAFLDLRCSAPHHKHCGRRACLAVVGQRGVPGHEPDDPASSRVVVWGLGSERCSSPTFPSFHFARAKGERRQSRRLGGDHGLALPRTGVSDALRGGPELVGVIDSRMNLSWDIGHCSRRFGRGVFVRWQAAPAFQAAVERVRGAGSARTR